MHYLFLDFQRRVFFRRVFIFTAKKVESNHVLNTLRLSLEEIRQRGLKKLSSRLVQLAGAPKWSMATSKQTICTNLS